MSLRMALLLTAIAALIGTGVLIYPSLQERAMIRQLGNPNGIKSYHALAWLVRRHGAAGLELGYAYGSLYIRQQLPFFVEELYLPAPTVISPSSASLMKRRLTGEEAFSLLLRGMESKDIKVQDNAANTLESIQQEKPLVTRENVGKILPLLNRPFVVRYYSSPLWRILEESNDPAMLATVSDDFLLRALAGRNHSQALNVLEKKYKMRKVRWTHGYAGSIHLPNPLLLKLLQSPDPGARYTACQQLACNYDAVASHTLAASASSDPMPGGGGDIEYHYSGPPLRHNRAVEKEMGISTAEVIHTLDTIYKKSPGYLFSDYTSFGSYLWYLLTGEMRKGRHGA